MVVSKYAKMYINKYNNNLNLWTIVKAVVKSKVAYFCGPFSRPVTGADPEIKQSGPDGERGSASL